MKCLFYFLVLVFMVACTSSNSRYKEPADIIPKDTMVSLLTDMYMASSSKNVKNKFSKKIKNYLPVVYEKYKIDSVRFLSSNNYYTSQIEAYSDILTSVKNNIEKEYKVFESAYNLKDSLKRAKRSKERALKKEKDSLKKAQKRDDYIPFILQEIVIDTTRFYSNSDIYTPKVKEYNFIELIFNEDADVLEGAEVDNKEIKKKNQKK